VVLEPSFDVLVQRQDSLAKVVSGPWAS
jgi:hypothetical protein